MLKTSIPPGEIIFLKANSNYTEFHLLDGQTKLSPRTLKHHQDNLLMKHFVRVSNSFLLNPSYIDSISRRRAASVVRLKDGTEVTVSRRRQNGVLDILKNTGFQARHY
ncbi:MAG: LytTR family transcriptional regulator [Leadbetterella sp.]|nr:LytTR family transcriptional regulator [Leadbetterella sp.]